MIAGWAYLRFRELAYDDQELDAIAGRLRALAARGVETFAYFRHGDEPHAPHAALTVNRRLGAAASTDG